jgi:hypothetical protein
MAYTIPSPLHWCDVVTDTPVISPTSTQRRLAYVLEAVAGAQNLVPSLNSNPTNRLQQIHNCDKVCVFAMLSHRRACAVVTRPLEDEHSPPLLFLLLKVLGVLREEGVPLVNIGAEDICDGNPKLLLGLLWLLILRYHIAQAGARLLYATSPSCCSSSHLVLSVNVARRE